MEEILNAYGSERFVVSVIIVSVALLVFAYGYRFWKSRTGPAPFIRGGKNRNPRLQVLDAAAVDNQRRLVLVRRDNVEHLIMIGGTTDIVIESGISTSHAAREFAQPPVAQARPAPLELASAPILDTELRQQPAIEPRPVPPRAVVAAPAEMRIETPRETAVAPERPARPARPAAVPAAKPEPDVEPVAETPAPRAEPPVRPVAEVRSEPLRPIAALAAANAAANSQSNIAAAALDSARERVFQPAPEPRVATPVVNTPVPPALQVPAEGTRQLGNDFERILEQEMASNLAAREAAAAGERSRQILARDPAAPKITGATPEPTLQNEVARIFGEMSASRDK